GCDDGAAPAASLTGAAPGGLKAPPGPSSCVDLVDDGWSYTPVGAAPGPDYAVRFDLRIDQATLPDGPVAEEGSFAIYNNDADLGGYEAGVALRRGAGRHYRVMFSAAWQEVLLWSSCGGILQVRPFPLAVG